MSDAFITNGRIIDPANNIDEVGNLSIVNGKVGGRLIGEATRCFRISTS